MLRCNTKVINGCRIKKLVDIELIFCSCLPGLVLVRTTNELGQRIMQSTCKGQGLGMGRN
jgi:hypothetical protein